LEAKKPGVEIRVINNLGQERIFHGEFEQWLYSLEAAEKILEGGGSGE